MTPLSLMLEIIHTEDALNSPEPYGLGLAPIKREGRRMFYDARDELRWNIICCEEVLMLMLGGRA